MTRVLLLAGTAEARALASQMATAGIDGVASLAGATRDPAPLALPTRVGGFGGRDGFVDYLKAEGLGAVVDATHPFAHRITDRTAEVCAELGLPYLQVLRSGWEPDIGDRWHWVDTAEEAAALLPEGAVVFLATGRQTATEFGDLSGRRVILRVIDPPTQTSMPEGTEYVIGRPPFTVLSERRLFEALGVEWLVVKDAGGEAGRAKLDAAWVLGIQVVILRRPPIPDAPRVETAAQAMVWIGNL